MSKRKAASLKAKVEKITELLSSARLNEMIEEATVDAYDESEQLMGFYNMIEENLALPFSTTVLGLEVIVENIEQGEFEEIVAVCRREKERQRISILNLPLPQPRPKARTRFRRWKNLLFDGKMDKLLKELRTAAQMLAPKPEILAVLADESPERILWTHIQYLETYREHMDYPRFRRKGWPISSGHVEATCKRIGNRMKGANKRWTREGAESRETGGFRSAPMERSKTCYKTCYSDGNSSAIQS